MTPFINLLCTRYGVIIRILFFASFTYVTFYMCVCAYIIVMYACIYNWILFLYFQLKNIFFSCHDINVNTLIFALLPFAFQAVENIYSSFIIYSFCLRKIWNYGHSAFIPLQFLSALMNNIVNKLTKNTDANSQSAYSNFT